MAASRSMLEALLARVQRRASEARPARTGTAAVESAVDDVDTLAPRPREALARGDAPEEDIEEYDEELIEIIDDSEMISQSAAAARAIEPAAFGATLDRRAPAVDAKASVPAARAPAGVTASAPAVAARSATARPSPAGEVVRPSPAAEALRPETVTPRPVAVTEVAATRGSRRELRTIPFIELLDASLDLGSD